MTFNPLGNFVVHAALNEGALVEGKRFFTELPTLPARSINRAYAHWSVGHYNQNFSDYNGSVRYDGASFHLDMSHDPSDNAIGVNNNEPAAHTYMRNTGAFGFATDDMNGASVHDYGTEPVTVLTLEYLCAGLAAVALKYGLDLSATSTDSPYAGEPVILTHAEAAMRGGDPVQYADYGITGTCERWDLASFIALPADETLSAQMAEQCGDAIRQRTRLYKQAMMGEGV